MKFIYNKYRNLRSNLVLLFFKMVYKSRFIIGPKVYVRKGFIITIENDGKVVLGKDVFFNNYCSINSLVGVEIGDNCIFGENVHIYDHNHVFNNPNIPINDQGFKTGKVTVGSNCWIGSNVTILKGVSIGNHSIIGAGCVIYSDVEPNSLVKVNQSLIRENVESMF